MANKRDVHIKVTSNVNSVLNKTGKSATKAGNQQVGVLGRIKGMFNGVAASSKLATGGIRAMTVALISSGVGAVVVALGAMVALFTKAVKESAEFEQALSGLKAITRGSAEDMRDLSENAKELGRTTAFTASEVVGLQTEFAKLGFSTADILQVTEATLSLAAAAGTDLATAAMVAGNTLNGFGLQTSETGRIADVMALSFASSALDIEKFQESMKLVAPIAKVAKVSLEGSAAALSVLADRGVAGSLAGTQLRKIMADLSTKTGKNFQDSLTITAKRLDAATSTAEKLSIAKELVGDRAKGSLIALAENREELDRLTLAYENAGGAADEMANEKLDNLRGDVTKLSSAWSGFLLGIEDGAGTLNKLIRGALQGFTWALNNIGAAFDMTAFIFTDGFMIMKKVGNNVMEFLSIAFGKFGANIKIFANNAMFFISKIPIIGAGIDKAQVAKNIKDAEDALLDLNKRLEEAEAERELIKGLKATKRERFQKQQDEKELIRLKNKARREAEAAATQKKGKIEGFVEGGAEGDKKEDPEIKRLEELAKFKKKLREKERDAEAEDELMKNELARTRHLEAMERLKITADEKAILTEDINAYYDERSQEIALSNKERDDLAAEQKDLEKKERMEALHQMEMDLANEALDNAIGIAGQESDLGKALFAVKQILFVREMIMQAKKRIEAAKSAVAEAALAGSEGVAHLAKGSGKALSTLNPAVIAAYAVSALSIGGAIASAISAAKSKASKFGVSSSGGSINTSVSAPKLAPALNIVGSTSAGEKMVANTISRRNNQPTKAYVVSGEVTNTQQLENKVKNNASF